MELLDYLKSLTASEQEQFAVRVGTTFKHLRNVAYKGRRASAALAAQIAIETDGAVPLSVTRSKDWKLIWDSRLNRLIEASAAVDHNDAQPNGVESASGGVIVQSCRELDAQCGSDDAPASCAPAAEHQLAHLADANLAATA